MRVLFFIVLLFLGFFVFVGVVLGNPLPWDPFDSFFHLEPIQYFSIVISEFCALIVGIGFLSYKQQVSWRKVILIMFCALTISYFLGVVIWGVAFQTGIFPFNLSNPISLIVLFLPEIIGILLGAVIIKKLQKTTWKTALITMTISMLTSLIISLLLATIYLKLL